MKISPYLISVWLLCSMLMPQDLMANNGVGALSDLRMEDGGAGGEFFDNVLALIYVGTFFGFLYDIIKGAIRGEPNEKLESQNFLLVAFAMLTCPILGDFLFGFEGFVHGAFYAIPVGYRVNAWHKKEEIFDFTYLLITIFSFTFLPWAFYELIGDRFLFIFILFLAPISRKLNELRFKIL